MAKKHNYCPAPKHVVVIPPTPAMIDKAIDVVAQYSNGDQKQFETDMHMLGLERYL